MNCPFCNQENGDDALFCKHCGKELNQSIICPACKNACAPNTRFCTACGTELNPAPQEEAKPAKQGLSEKAQNRLRLASGILMMCAVFFALLFVFFIGTTQRITDRGYSDYETYSVWYFFGRAYTQLRNTSVGWDYSSYAMAAHYLPVVLTTIVAAATLVLVITYSLLATVKFGLHFKHPNDKYYKYAVVAVFSFLLGATLFDCIHSISTENNSGELSSATQAGMAFCCMLLITSIILKTVAMGKSHARKQTIVDSILTLAAILSLAFVIGFAKEGQAEFIRETYNHVDPINFFRTNSQLAFLFDAKTPVTSDYVASFTLSLFAVTTQIAVIVLAFVALMFRVGSYTEKHKNMLGFAIAITAVAAVNIIFSAIAIEYTNKVIFAQANVPTELVFAVAPAMTFVAALFHLALSITQKVLAKKAQKEIE